MAGRGVQYKVIFEADTPPGKAFDLALIALIVLSAVVVMLLSVPDVRAVYGGELRAVEITITVLFLIEYGFRLVSARGALRYAVSAFGIIDLVSTVAPLLALFLPEIETMAIVRLARVLRILRVVRVAAWVKDADVLVNAVLASMRKIALFMGFVFVVVSLLGASMYAVEGPERGFTSIPLGIYWAIVTVTTVGYGDLVPQTSIGRVIASLSMMLGYAILAVPTGIVATELNRTRRGVRSCARCGAGEHSMDARFCRRCAERLAEEPVKLTTRQ